MESDALFISHFLNSVSITTYDDATWHIAYMVNTHLYEYPYSIVVKILILGMLCDVHFFIRCLLNLTRELTQKIIE